MASARADRHAAAALRKRLRLSYGCDCCGPVEGRQTAVMTNGVFDTVEQWTGHRPASCPWRAFSHPLVRQVIDAWPYFERNSLSIWAPEPSHRLVLGLRLFAAARDRIASEQHRLAAESRGRA